ncbi:hypothetical protein A3A66_00935 [Microgenomates group bacterium RIFCSPLOWO2_01_FULL_46_13]|nr:MAG: hypothetical protein A2783_01010 [Microgenomates group bacterium RIFCSPHIGHO2_01_FULL_45_11]OGV94572.1 MAG: hypothetical protein A3A66_00935 [Microgenomates group bacterium RIFCSPLOWO2_01_FULL_46_13]
MKEVRDILKKLKQRGLVVVELFWFLWEARLWWLVPMVAVLLLFGVLLIFAESSAVAPFIYTLF